MIPRECAGLHFALESIGYNHKTIENNRTRFTILARELDCWKCSLSCFDLIGLLRVDDHNTYVCI